MYFGFGPSLFFGSPNVLLAFRPPCAMGPTVKESVSVSLIFFVRKSSVWLYCVVFVILLYDLEVPPL